MDNRTLIAIILSILVIIGYQYFFTPQAPQTPPATEQKTVEDGNTESVKPAASPVVSETKVFDERQIKVDNELYTAVFTSKGGTLKYWEIKQHKDQKGNNIALLNKPGPVPALAIGSRNDFDLSELNFAVSGNNLNLDSGNPSGSVVFEYAKDNIMIRRTYTFHADTYRVDLTDEVSGIPEYWITVGSDFGIYENTDDFIHVGPVLLKGSDLEELNPKKLDEPKKFRDDLKWIAQEDKYFFASIVPQSPVAEVAAFKQKGSPVIAFRADPGTHKFIIYAGPKESERLSKLNIGLEHIINFGFFSIIARPLFWLLKFFNSFANNYGYAIILVTIVTRIPFIPLLNKGQKSMKKLQDIQPKMAEIKEKYKKDPQKMQKEMTELYKKHKVNPVGGCLPMLLQIPVFFALYKVLLIAIELRGAPFTLWITDLSVKDPYYVLPIVMGITMVIQQKMTPSGMDPKQAKLMMLMPVIFTFLFLNFASGLVLYWLINNILGIIQQFFTNRKLAKETPA